MNYDPNKNKKVIAIEEQDDGNWIAEGQRFGKLIKVRGASPLNVLQGLLTSDGSSDNITV